MLTITAKMRLTSNVLVPLTTAIGLSTSVTAIGFLPIGDALEHRSVESVAHAKRFCMGLACASVIDPGLDRTEYKEENDVIKGMATRRSSRARSWERRLGTVSDRCLAEAFRARIAVRGFSSSNKCQRRMHVVTSDVCTT